MIQKRIPFLAYFSIASASLYLGSETGTSKLPYGQCTPSKGCDPIPGYPGEYVPSVCAQLTSPNTTLITPVWQCLKTWYKYTYSQYNKSAPTTNEEGQILIYNAGVENCSPETGASAGCGVGLECNWYECDPMVPPNGLGHWYSYPLGKRPTSSLHETCGALSVGTDNICQTGLTCQKVRAVVNGDPYKTKYVCLSREELGPAKADLAALRAYVKAGGLKKRVVNSSVCK